MRNYLKRSINLYLQCLYLCIKRHFHFPDTTFVFLDDLNLDDSCDIKLGKRVNLSNNLIILSDINECKEGIHTCDDNAKCTNTDGSFTCSCNEGYTGDGQTCGGN